jgi:hypothetical protein
VKQFFFSALNFFCQNGEKKSAKKIEAKGTQTFERDARISFNKKILFPSSMKKWRKRKMEESGS